MPAPPGTFAWMELATRDADAALAFYTGLLGWTPTSADLGGVTLSAGWLVPDREAAYLPAVRDVDTHLVSVRVYDGDGKLAETRFIKRTRKPAA